jgi:hypothetical protein
MAGPSGCRSSRRRSILPCAWLKSAGRRAFSRRTAVPKYFSASAARSGSRYASKKIIGDEEHQAIGRVRSISAAAPVLPSA